MHRSLHQVRALGVALLDVWLTGRSVGWRWPVKHVFVGLQYCLGPARTTTRLLLLFHGILLNKLPPPTGLLIWATNPFNYCLWFQFLSSLRCFFSRHCSRSLLIFTLGVNYIRRQEGGQGEVCQLAPDKRNRLWYLNHPQSIFSKPIYLFIQVSRPTGTDSPPHWDDDHQVGHIRALDSKLELLFCVAVLFLLDGRLLFPVFRTTLPIHSISTQVNYQIHYLSVLRCSSIHVRPVSGTSVKSEQRSILMLVPFLD